MKTSKHLLATLTFLSITSAVIAQAPEQEKSLDAGPINSQFEYIVEKSNRYQDFKVIKMAWIDKLKGNVSDSLEALRKELDDTRKLVDDQNIKIEAINAELENTNDSLAYVNMEKNSVDLLSFHIEKSLYKNTMWSLLGGLFLFLLFYIFRFKRSNAVTSQAKKTLREIQEEFNEYKKRALEKEQKLARELQNELNKRPPSKW